MALAHSIFHMPGGVRNLSIGVTVNRIFVVCPLSPMTSHHDVIGCCGIHLWSGWDFRNTSGLPFSGAIEHSLQVTVVGDRTSTVRWWWLAHMNSSWDWLSLQRLRLFILHCWGDTACFDKLCVLEVRTLWCADVVLGIDLWELRAFNIKLVS